MKLENVATGSFEEILIDDGFYVLKIQNEGVDNQQVTREINKRYIHWIKLL